MVIPMAADKSIWAQLKIYRALLRWNNTYKWFTPSWNYILQKTSINKFKEQGEGEFTKELAQLHVQETFFLVDATKLTNKQLSEAVA